MSLIKEEFSLFLKPFLTFSWYRSAAATPNAPGAISVRTERKKSAYETGIKPPDPGDRKRFGCSETT